MFFFIEHFNHFTFLHAPHKWFLALLASPIHFLELHYKKRYHLKYAHAKKLFVFDMALLASALAIIGVTIYWSLYNPSIANSIYLNIESSANRTASGDYETFNIVYKNNSNKKITNTILTFDLPNTFVTDKVEPSDAYSPLTHSLNIGNLDRGANGNLKISGWFYSIPEKDLHISARLTYKQDDISFIDEKNITIIKILRGSTLQLETTVPDKILSPGQTPITLSLKNSGNQTLENITLPFNPTPDLKYSSFQSEKGEIKDNKWHLTKLEPSETAELSLVLNANSGSSDKINISLTPTIQINNITLPQAEYKKTLEVIRPEVALTNSWNLEKIKPGETATLKVKIVNNGNTNLNDLQLELPLPSEIINLNSFKNLNHGELKNNLLLINKNYIPGFNALTKNQTLELELTVPIKDIPTGGNNLTLILAPRLKTKVTGIENGLFEISNPSPALKIGTALQGTAEIRYYTIEGDQLGRGALPPKVGKETKYWAMLNLTNGTSRASNVVLTAKLPNYVKYSGRSSVSIGKQVEYNTNLNTVTWKTPTLEAHEQAGVYFEISFTPSDTQINSTPVLIQNLSLIAHDDYLDENITPNIKPNTLDASLKTDLIAQEKGVVIQ